MAQAAKKAEVRAEDLSPLERDFVFYAAYHENKM